MLKYVPKQNQKFLFKMKSWRNFLATGHITQSLKVTCDTDVLLKTDAQ